jgi:enoyl-CoA hydratase/carnithine racemase
MTILHGWTMHEKEYHMNYEHLIVHASDDFIGEITFNRPEHLNTFNTCMAKELDHALGVFDRDEKIRVILLKALGKAFCVGIDVSEFSDKTALEYSKWIECIGNPLETMGRLCKPIIAQVHGVAAAIGAGLVAAADLAVVSEDARFGLTAINVGLNCIHPVIPITRSIGRKRALELLLYGNLIDAKQALEIGLVNRVVPPGKLEQKGHEWAAVLAQKSPLAVQVAKKAFYTTADMDYYKALEYTSNALGQLCATEDAKEGIRAFLDKRKPVWKGR